MQEVPVPQVTLENCESEPIHIPGSIQPHGALVALGPDGRVLTRSENFSAYLGIEAQPGELLPELLTSQLALLVDTAIRPDEGWLDSTHIIMAGKSFDVIAHRFLQVIYLEFEPQVLPHTASHQSAAEAQRIIAQIRHARDIDVLLRHVTVAIRELTQYDRVMAYRFRPDDSGEVVAEAHASGLVSYLGQRYPASVVVN